MYSRREDKYGAKADMGNRDFSQSGDGLPRSDDSNHYLLKIIDRLYTKKEVTVNIRSQQYSMGRNILVD